MRRTLLIMVAAFFLIGIMYIAEVNAGSTILFPTDDTWIYGYASYQDTNFGGEQGLATNMHSYNQLGFPFLKFSIPSFSGEEIQTATLHLYQYDGAGVGVQATVIDLYPINMWDENTITWNNFYNPSATLTYLATCNDGALYRGWSSWSFAWHKSYGDTITIRVREGGSADNSHVWSSKEYSNADLHPYLELITTESFPWEMFLPAIIKKSIDKDKDGFTKEQGDCNDSDSSINPDATEICGDGIDQDCDGSDLPCPLCHDISGVWEFVFTNINSSCGPESDWSSTVTIVQNGCSLVANGFKNKSLEVTGSIENYTVTIGPGDFPEDGGITTSTFTLTLNTSETSMEGKESWTWNYLGSDACINGTGDIIATKR